MLTLEQKQCRDDVSIECLVKFHSPKAEFLGRSITMDKIWVHHFTPKTKEQSKQWTVKGKPPQRMKLSASSIMQIYCKREPQLTKKEVLFQGRLFSFR